MLPGYARASPVALAILLRVKAHSKTYQLVLTLPDSEPILCRLEGKRIRLGRGTGNQIQIPLKAISSKHCEFRVDAEAGRCELIDLGSTNGTRVNGSTLEEETFALRHGDKIVLGDAVTAEFIAAVEAVVRERQAEEKELEPTQVVRTVNPVAAAIAKQEAALRERQIDKKSKRRKSGTFRLF